MDKCNLEITARKYVKTYVVTMLAVYSRHNQNPF